MDHVTGAARSLQEAIRALGGQPPPKPRRRGLRTAALLGAALATGAAAAYIDRRDRNAGASGTGPEPMTPSPVSPSLHAARVTVVDRRSVRWS